MSQSKPSQYLGEFTKLNPQVSLYTSSIQPRNGDVPTLITLCAWMFAAPRHIAKYTRLYQDNVPHADILLIRPVVGDMIWISDSAQFRQLGPAVTVIKRFLNSVSTSTEHHGRPKYNFIFHVFSNGGSHAAVQLAEAFTTFYPSEKIPISSLILDSCPGAPSAVLSANAIIQALPKAWFVRVIGTALIYLVAGGVLVLDVLGLSESAVSKTRRELNSRAQSFMQPGVPRVYLYSKMDRMVPWQEIVEHADEARERLGGPLVQTVEFQESEHVGHLPMAPEKYWASIVPVVRP